MNLRTVLILADQKEIFSSLKKVLDKQFFILFTSSPKEAAQLVKKYPHIVSAVCVSYELADSEITDSAQSPCIEFLNELRTDNKAAKIPVIVTSKNHSEEAERKAIENGAADFIHEPYDEHIVLRRLKNLIELHEAAATVTTVTHDEFTGLYTKKYFLMQAAKILENGSSKPFDLICIYVERLKLVSEICGTEVGDQILKQLGQRILDEAKTNNGISSRFSDNIFFILMERPAEYSKLYFADFLNTLNDFPQIKEFNLHIRILFGVYQIPKTRVPLNVMCECAQMAAEKAKSEFGKIVCVYDDSLLEKKKNDQKIAASMENALANNEFLVYYQPKYNLNSESVAGAEALVRWNNKDLGFMQPDKFIPLFEKNGFIAHLDKFICEKVCKDLRDWIDAGNSPVAISVNIFRADLFNQNLASTLLGVVKKYNIPPKYLHLEITETSYTEDPEQIVKTIYELRKHDFVIELGNFGSGYSSLNMLSEVPIDILKLDKDFVQNELERTNGKGILYYVINLAKQLGITVVAEGIETKAQAQQLKNLRCNYVQGFYFSKPLNRDEFFALLKKSDVSEIVKSSKARDILNVEGRAAESVSNDDAAASDNGIMLIVDDVESSRLILAEMFKSEYEIALAANGLEAWDYIQENYNKISIVILDLEMPELDGFEVLCRVRADSRTKALPIMVTSQQGDSETEQKALEMDADDFLAKPYNAMIMKHRVQNVVAHSLVQKLEQEKTLTQKILEIERQAQSDFLTGLDNRTMLEKAVGEFFGKSETFDAVFISLDIDDFKTINDTFGHLAGDDTIKKVAQLLRAFFDKRSCVCRMGGDEFAVFVPLKYTREALEKTLKELCATLRFNVETLKVTCSLGVATAPDFGMDYQTLYNNSDMALLGAKRYGKNQFNIFSGNSVLPSYVFYRNMDWLLDEFSDAVFVCYAESYDLIYLNKLACKIANKEKKDCVGKKCYNVIFNRDAPCDFCIKREEMKHDFVQKNIFPYEDKSTCYTMRAKIVNWSGFDARIQYLRESSLNTNLLQTLGDVQDNSMQSLDKFPCGICKFELSPFLPIVMKNKEMYQMFGYEEDEFKNKFHDSFEKLISNIDRVRVINKIKECIKKSENIMLKFRVESVDENLRQVVAAGKIVAEGGKKKYVYMNLILADFIQALDAPKPAQA